MKFTIFIVLSLLSFSVEANDCVTPEEYSAHYMGYLAFSENHPYPVLMWWRGKIDHEASDIDGKFVGVETLSMKTIFQNARRILKKKRADYYFIAWPDTIKLDNRIVEVVKVSFAYSKNSPAYDVAFETILKPSSGHDGELVATPVPFELGCSANLLK